MQGWREAKFGLFIHFGLYSILGRGEWVMWNERIDTSDYSPLDWRYPGFFLPDLYRTNAEEMKKQTYTQVHELLTQ